MSDVKFKFDYFNDTDTLYIEGSKEFMDKNYVCSVRGSLCDIDLEESLYRIRISIQDKIISDLIESNKINFTFNNGKDIGIKLDGDYYNAYEETDDAIVEILTNKLKCKFDKLEKSIKVLECKVNELIK